MKFGKHFFSTLLFAACREAHWRHRLAAGILFIAAASLAQFFDLPWQSRRTSGAQAAALQGEAAIRQLKTDGGYASLAAALAAARQQLNIEPLLTPQQKLTAADGAAGDRFGVAVALSGNTAVIGAFADDVTGEDQGAAYVFTRSGTSWTLQKQLTANDGAAHDRFGMSVAISGDTVVVGAPFDLVIADGHQGAAYVFTRNGTVWTQQQKLTASDGAANDDFGRTVAISGDTVVVGAPFDDIGAQANQGSAYVFTRSGAVWTERQRLVANDGAANDNFGVSVALSGDTVAVGASRDEVGANVAQGSAYVFTRGGALWSQQQKLTAGDGAANDNFGHAVALSGETLVVGAPFDSIGANSSQGSAYVFTRRGAAWAPQQKLFANDGASADFFGLSVALAGDTVVVGAEGGDILRNGNQGAAYVFTRNGTVWTERRKLLAGDGAAGDNFGFSVALSGDTVLAGALNDDSGANTDQGAAYVFVIRGKDFVEQQQLVASDGAANDFFGGAVALSGDTVLVGAPGDDISAIDQGSAYVFVRNGADWILQQRLFANDSAAGDGFGGAVALDGDTAVVGAVGDDIGAQANQGSAYVFVRNGAFWNFQQKLTARDGAANDRFGSAVALDGDTVAAGAFLDDLGANQDQGSVYVFNRNGTVWTERQQLTANDGVANDNFGSAVALDGDAVAVGAVGDIISTNGRIGSAYVFTNNGGDWKQQQKLIANDTAFLGFGFSIALSGDTVVAGVLDDNSFTPGSQGSAYVFTRSGTVWTQQQKLIANDGAAHNFFSTSVAISGDTVAVGASFDGVGANANRGSVYVFTRNGTIWSAPQRLTASDGAGGDSFGVAVALDGDTVVAGANANAIGANRNQGSAYAFIRLACPALTLTPDNLPDAMLGAAYSQAVTVSGGAGPFQFSLSDGALPPGLMLAQNGQLTGTPMMAGAFRFSITATAANGCPAMREYALTVRNTTVVCVSAASFLPGAAPDSIVAAFGTQLSTQTQAAAALPLPAELGGVRARLRDSLGVERPASLFFVSPGQINLLVPAGTASGAATLSISNSNLSNAATGELTVTRTAPGLFAANANGQGVPAAVALRVRAGGAQSFEPVARPEGNRFVPAPIDLGPAGEQVFLVLFGTGLRFQQSITASVGGTNANVLFAGAAAGFAGLDQVNLLLPRALAGRGEVDVVLRVDGMSANAARVSVR